MRSRHEFRGRDWETGCAVDDGIIYPQIAQILQIGAFVVFFYSLERAKFLEFSVKQGTTILVFS